MQKLVNCIIEGKGYVRAYCANKGGNTWEELVERDFMGRPLITISETEEDRGDFVPVAEYDIPFGKARSWPSYKGQYNFNAEWLRNFLNRPKVQSWEYIRTAS